jgi:hypothetical protein
LLLFDSAPAPSVWNHAQKKTTRTKHPTEAAPENRSTGRSDDFCRAPFAQRANQLGNAGLQVEIATVKKQGESST